MGKKFPEYLAKNKLFIVIFLFALLYISSLNGYLSLFGDDALFVVLAESITQGKYALISEPGEPAHAKHPPFFPLLLSPIIMLFGHNYLMMKIIPCLSLIIGLFVLYKILMELDPSLSRKVLVVSASFPLVYIFSHVLMSEAVYILLSLGALYFLNKMFQERKTFSLSLILGAVFAALAFLTRAIGITIILAAVMTGAIRFFAGKKRKKIFLQTAGVGIIFFCLCLFWLIGMFQGGGPEYISEFAEGEDNQLIKGESVFPDTKTNLAYRLLDNLYYYSGPIISLDLSKIISAEKLKLGEYVVPFGIITWILIFSGLTARLLRRQSIFDVYVLFYLAVVFLWFWRSLRFLSPILPFLILYFFLSLRFLLKLFSKKHARLSFSLIYGLVLMVSVSGFFYEFRRQHRSPFYNKEWDSYYKASLWLRQADEGIVLSRKSPNTFLWSGHKSLMAPVTSDVEFMKEFIEKNDVRYVIIDEIERYRTGEYLSFIPQSGQFRLIHQEDHARVFERISR